MIILNFYLQLLFQNRSDGEEHDGICEEEAENGNGYHNPFLFEVLKRSVVHE